MTNRKNDENEKFIHQLDFLLKICIVIIAVCVIAILSYNIKLYVDDYHNVMDNIVYTNTDIVYKDENKKEIKHNNIAEPLEEIDYSDDTDDSIVSENDVELISKTVYGEALATESDEEMSAVVWCILNRLESNLFPNTIEGVVLQDSQFFGYNCDNPVDEHIKKLVLDVIDRWEKEISGNENSGRTLPKDYLYFTGDGFTNYFTKEYNDINTWDWSLENPYES